MDDGQRPGASGAASSGPPGFVATARAVTASPALAGTGFGATPAYAGDSLLTSTPMSSRPKRRARPGALLAILLVGGLAGGGWFAVKPRVEVAQIHHDFVHGCKKQTQWGTGCECLYSRTLATVGPARMRQASEILDKQPDLPPDVMAAMVAAVGTCGLRGPV